MGRLFKSFKTRIIISITGIVLLSLIINDKILYDKSRMYISQAVEENARNLMNSVNQMIKGEYYNMIHHEDTVLSFKRTELQDNSDIAYSILNRYYQMSLQGELSEKEAKEAALTSLEHLRYAQGTGYFWIHTADSKAPRMLMHPLRPELNGTIVDSDEFKTMKSSNENIFSASVKLIQKEGKGYFQYTWTDNNNNLVPKVAFVKHFPPWNWVYATGLTLADLNKHLKEGRARHLNDLNEIMINQKIGQSGYFFIFNEVKEIIVHPLLAGITDETVYEGLDPQAAMVLLDKIKIQADSGSPYFDYLWDKPGDPGNFIYNKRVYFTYYEPLQWYICASIYTEELEEKSYKLRTSIRKNFIVFTVLTVLLSAIVTRSLISPLKNLIKSISDTDSDGLPQKPLKETSTTEVNVLSRTINRMINTIDRSRTALKTQRDFSMGIINGSPYIICGLSLQGNTIFINPAGEKISGFTIEEITGKKWWEITCAPEDVKKLSLLKKMIYEKDVHNFEMPLTCKDKSKRSILWSTLSKRDMHNNVLEFVIFGDDITERKKNLEDLKVRTEELATANRMLREHQNNLETTVKERTRELQESLDNLKETQDQLIHSEKMASLGELIAGVAHEINTPLGTCITAISHSEYIIDEFFSKFTQGILTREDFEFFMKQSIESCTLISENLSQASSLIQNFKQVAVDQTSEKMRDFAIYEYTNEILSSLHPVFTKAGCEVIVKCRQEFIVHSYPGSLSQIINHLIMNSLEHGVKNRKDGLITIEIIKNNNEVCIIFSDNGRGIPEDILSRIYDPFFTTRRGMGFRGLGLNIVYNLIKQSLKGSIAYTPSKKQGACFTITFPCKLLV